MPTIEISGYGRRSFTRPRDLVQEAPFGPTQPIADWPDELRQFTEAIAAGQFDRAVRILCDFHVKAKTDDVDVGARAAFKAYAANVHPGARANLTSHFDQSGSEGTWW